MNRKGQVFLLVIVFMVAAIMVVLSLFDPAKEVAQDVTSSGRMDCGNSSIPLSTKLPCWAIRGFPAYFVLILLYYLIKWGWNATHK